jgi:hypothetical protein
MAGWTTKNGDVAMITALAALRALLSVPLAPAMGSLWLFLPQVKEASLAELFFGLLCAS